ncbi:MAG: phosphoribosylformylglycinamidine synthase subunit PurS [Candidatus Binatia bacterium]
MTKVKVYVTLKNAVLDPQGKAVEQSLHSLGYRGVEAVRMGKYLEFNIEAPSCDEAKIQVREMCEKVLANPVIEDYRFEIEEAPGSRH